MSSSPRHRARQRAGISCFTVEADVDVVDELVLAGLVAPYEADDRCRCAGAMGELLKAWARSRRVASSVDERTVRRRAGRGGDGL